MANQAYPPHVGSLGSTIRIGHGLTMWCENWDCHHNTALDLPALAARYGEDLPIAALVARSVCSECGARYPKISIKVAVLHAPQVIARQ